MTEDTDDTPLTTDVRPSFVYLLVAYNPYNQVVGTYVGATVDVDKRLRQHNKEIKGGAHATGMRVSQGCIWKRHCYIAGFPTWNAALQFEWRWKQITRKQNPSTPPVERRMKALDTLLSLERSTTKAVPYLEWPTPPEVIWS
jgi:structure-specific endonuclease subunit SLX1